MAERRDVVVIGGGVVGCAIAHALAPDHDVLLLEKGRVAGEASGLAAGLVGPSVFYPDVPDAVRHANDFFREFSGTGPFRFIERPRIVLVEPDVVEDARADAEAAAEAGLDVTYLDAVTAADRYPRFTFADFPGVVEYADNGWVDPFTYTRTLAEAAADRGAEIRTWTPVDDVRVDDGAVAGVAVPGDEIGADHVICAAGWRTRDLLADRLELPVRPHPMRAVVLEPGEPADGSFPLVRVPSLDLYLRPELNGDLVVGGGPIDPEAYDFRRTSTGGPVDAAYREWVAGTVPGFLPDAADARFIDGWTGVGCVTPDGCGIVDAPADGPDGLVVATGFSGLGVMTSPIAAAIARSLVSGEEAPFPTDRFALDRFEARTPDFEPVHL